MTELMLILTDDKQPYEKKAANLKEKSKRTLLPTELKGNRTQQKKKKRRGGRRGVEESPQG